MASPVLEKAVEMSKLFKKITDSKLSMSTRLNKVVAIDRKSVV